MWRISLAVPKQSTGRMRIASHYFPLSVGNSWLYEIRPRPKFAAKTVKWTVTQRETIRGKTVFHLWPTPAQGDEPLSLSRVEAGIVEEGTERFLLKNPLLTGGRWTAKSLSLKKPGAVHTFDMVSVGKACSVGSHSFDDCAIVRETDEANNLASVTTYARGIGPVRYVYFKGLQSGEIETTLTIESWVLHD